MTNQTIDGVMVLRAAVTLVRSNEAPVKDAAIRELRALLDAPAPRPEFKKVEMAHVMNALEDVRGKPVLTSNQCHDLARALNDRLLSPLQLLAMPAEYLAAAQHQGDIETLRSALRTEVAAGDSWKREALELREKLKGQAKVEPVALIERARSFVTFVAKCVRKNGEYAPLHRQEMEELDRDLKLYAEQPAPVAVVLPERMHIPDAHCPERINAQGWNACLDELKRLNPSL